MQLHVVHTRIHYSVATAYAYVCMYARYMLVLILCNVWCIQCVMCESVVLSIDYVW